MTTYPKFSKIPRWSNDTFTITEKIDGTNGLIYIFDHAAGEPFPYKPGALATAIVGSLEIYVGSRKRWITPEQDNFGFARWVQDNAEEIAKLGQGHHYGEWYGSGIQRGYGLQKGEKRFALFNIYRWLIKGSLPTDVVETVPLIERCGAYELSVAVSDALYVLHQLGSRVNGFRDPEGVVIHSGLNGATWKRLLENDETPKSAQVAAALPEPVDMFAGRAA